MCEVDNSNFTFTSRYFTGGGREEEVDTKDLLPPPPPNALIGYFPPLFPHAV